MCIFPDRREVEEEGGKEEVKCSSNFAGLLDLGSIKSQRKIVSQVNNIPYVLDLPKPKGENPDTYTKLKPK